jgi:Spy/CpxP family protein refolding chaperone
MMSRRSYLIVIVLLTSFLFALSVASPAAPDDSPQEKIKEGTPLSDAPQPKGVSPAKPGIKPPVPAEVHRCGCCCCCRCCCCGETSGCKAWSKNPRSKPLLGSHYGKAVMVEKCLGEAGQHEGKEVEIIRGHSPGPKHRIIHGDPLSIGASCSNECMHSCGKDCGAECMRKIVKTHGNSCSKECIQSCGNQVSSDCMRMIGRGHRQVCMSHYSSSEKNHCGPGCLLKHASVLGLTDEQQDELSDLDFATKKKMIDLRAALQKERLELHKMMNENELKATAIKRQLDAIASAEADVKFERISAMIAARKILTEEQRELLKEKMHMHGEGCCEGHMNMGMDILESCQSAVMGEGCHTIDVYVDDDKGECIKIIETGE